MGRINVDLPDDLHKQLRLEKAETETPIKDLVSEALVDKYRDDESVDET